MRTWCHETPCFLCWRIGIDPRVTVVRLPYVVVGRQRYRTDDHGIDAMFA